MSVQVLQGDCIQVMRALKDNSVDAIVTDPPYGLEFMGKEWDRFSGKVSDRDFKGFVLSQQRTRNVKCPDCGKWAYDHPGRLCECGGVRRMQVHTFQIWCEQWAAECLRVLKPGGHLLAFGGTRTYHRMACAIEDAGFEIRDSLHWIYGSGFPKSLDVSKAIDKAAGAEREVVGINQDLLRRKPNGMQTSGASSYNFATDQQEKTAHVTDARITAPATDDAARWEGWGTAIKPAHEPIVVARKPLTGTVAANVLEYGTGALNIDGCRIGSDLRVNQPAGNKSGGASYMMSVTGMPQDAESRTAEGRWPPNILLTHSADCKPVGTRNVRGDNRKGNAGRRPGGFVNIEAASGDPEPNGPLYGDSQVQAWDCAPGCPVAELDRQSGVRKSGSGNFIRRSSADFEGNTGAAYGAESRKAGTEMVSYGDEGGVSRFFPCFKYQAKAKPSERPKVDGINHPTVKPLDLMRWLVRLITPPGGVCLDPFAGSGTTGEACLDEGFNCILIEREPDYIKLINARLAKREPTLWD